MAHRQARVVQYHLVLDVLERFQVPNRCALLREPPKSPWLAQEPVGPFCIQDRDAGDRPKVAHQGIVDAVARPTRTSPTAHRSDSVPVATLGL
jgi:hypothetical protein